MNPQHCAAMPTTCLRPQKSNYNMEIEMHIFNTTIKHCFKTMLIYAVFDIDTLVIFDLDTHLFECESCL